MNELKATAGPWHQELTDIGDCNQPSTRRVFGSDNSYEATICELWSGVGNQKANAALIAAAPAMYEEIKYHLEMTRLMPDGEQTDDFKRMDALLKKARGE